jgi:capsular polysaccharide biosynthesis protein
VILFEYRDRTLRTEADVRAALGLPVLAVIRTLGVEQEQQRRPRVLRLLARR